MKILNDYKNNAAVFKALGNPARLMIIDHLASGECCVCDLVDLIKFDFSTISKHLTVLRHAGLVESDKRGKKVYYQLSAKCIIKFMNCLEGITK